MLSVLSGLLLGFFGSLHCVGMCGPIVLVLPGAAGARGWGFVTGRALYNFGRALTYAALGLVIGLIGQSIAMAGWQQALGIGAGALMVLSVVLPAALRWWRSRAARNTAGGANASTAGSIDGAANTAAAGNTPRGADAPGTRRSATGDSFLVTNRVTLAVRTRLGALLRAGAPSSLLVIGILNGFLPCGLIYTALAASLAFGSAVESSIFMFLFGLGTAPALIALSYAAGMITHAARKRIARWLPVGVVVMGVLFILRSLSLGIPFISPDIDKVTSRMSGQTSPTPRREASTERALPPHPSPNTKAASGDAAPRNAAGNAAQALKDSVPPCCQ